MSDFIAEDRVAGRKSLPTLQDEAFDDGSTTRVEVDGGKPRTRGVFVQMNGRDAGRIHRLDAALTTFGRGQQCTVQLDDTSLSRVHARVLRDGAAFTFQDASSLNGSYVNGARATSVALHDGDRVRLASGVSLRFQLVDDDEVEALVRAYESSVRDGLTGTLNRRRLEERLIEELCFATRHGAELAVVILDLDHFKHINDTHGHLAGDAVLRAAASVVTATVRREDVVGRYGGEEFAIVARGIPLDGAARLAERIRAAVEGMRIQFGDRVLQVTLSAGVASVACCPGTPSVASLFARADERLYDAKRAGRNTIVAG